MDKFGNYDFIEGYFHNEPVYVVASGASLMGFDFRLLQGRRKVVISHVSFFCKPEPGDILAFLDKSPTQKMLQYWPTIYTEDFKTVVGPRTGLQPAANVAVVPLLTNTLSMSPRRGLLSPNSSGVFGLSIALAAGASHVYLLGHDCIGEGNFYNTKDVKGYHKKSKDRYERMARPYKYFESMKDKITNLSDISTIKQFEKKHWSEHFYE